jgi:hypothetical protein
MAWLRLPSVSSRSFGEMAEREALTRATTRATLIYAERLASIMLDQERARKLPRLDKIERIVIAQFAPTNRKALV